MNVCAMNKGKLALWLTVFMTAGALLTGDPRSLFFTLSITALVGCATNTIAIRMLFDRVYLIPWKQKWPLPYSGILEQKRVEVAAGIGWTVSKRLLSPETIMKNVRSEEFQNLTSAVLSEKLHQMSEDKVIMDHLIDEMERALVNFAHSDIFRQKLQKAIYGLDRVDEMLESAVEENGTAEKPAQESFTARILLNIKGRLSHFRERETITPHLQREMQRVLKYICEDEFFRETVQQFIQKLPEKFYRVDSPLKDDMGRHSGTILQDLVEKMEIEKMVIDEVCAFPPGVLRDLMYRITADNLQWLEVWGAIMGGMGGAVLWMLARYV